jgi:hypothetical protein
MRTGNGYFYTNLQKTQARLFNGFLDQRGYGHFYEYDYPQKYRNRRRLRIARRLCNHKYGKRDLMPGPLQGRKGAFSGGFRGQQHHQDFQGLEKVKLPPAKPGAYWVSASKAP